MVVPGLDADAVVVDVDVDALGLTCTSLCSAPQEFCGR
ncbi:hypothetical protein N798_04865 [Knoellia flava TL1]|uniref:Uncharacterized protein n=1 Tax=Knoellia flava TL1 TaxID=1385518 RepID=A0ABR4XG47_9MICO|nr:hypothetical protein N798_04865 [Knoellia flava TL1]